MDSGGVPPSESPEEDEISFSHTRGTKIIDHNGREVFLNGINLGNWLVWEGYLMMDDFKYRTHTQFFNSLATALGSVERAAEFEHQWRLSYVDERAIRELADLGFNSVRVPFNYKLFWDGTELTNDGFQYIDQLLTFCKTHEIYVLLDLHGAPGYQNPGDHADNHLSNELQPRESVQFWDDDNVALTGKIWQHIARYYRDEPYILGYDLINEPVPQAGREFELLPSLIAITKAIREVDPNHVIVAEGSWWASDLTKLDWLDPQVQQETGVRAAWDHNLIYQIHHYGPAEETFGREEITNRLNIPLIIGEFGESDNGNLRAIANWAGESLAGAFPWSFKKMSHDRTLWTIPSNVAYERVKTFINDGGSPPIDAFDDMMRFARENIRNGHPSHIWHQDFYDAVKP